MNISDTEGQGRIGIMVKLSNAELTVLTMLKRDLYNVTIPDNRSESERFKELESKELISSVINFLDKLTVNEGAVIQATHDLLLSKEQLEHLQDQKDNL